MTVVRPILGFASLILIAGACLLSFLSLLGGGIDKNPTNQYYFLEADTSGIAGASDVSRWTFWSVCDGASGRNVCPKVHAAYPLDPPRNFGTDSNIPSQFIGTHKFYYLTRFMFAFNLIALFFAVLSLFLGLLALCSRIGSYLSSGLTAIALFFQFLTAALMTAAYVQGRDAFRSAGRTAKLGRYNFGFLWAAAAALFLATVFLCAGGKAGGSSSKATGGSGGGVFGRFRGGRSKSTRSNRNRGSFIDKDTPLTNGA